jgi:hypothetical protein
VSDGEQRWSSFATYPVTDTLAGTGLANNLGPGGQCFAIFADGFEGAPDVLLGLVRQVLLELLARVGVDLGAERVSMDFTEGRLATRNDPRNGGHPPGGGEAWDLVGGMPGVSAT